MGHDCQGTELERSSLYLTGLVSTVQNHGETRRPLVGHSALLFHKSDFFLILSFT